MAECCERTDTHDPDSDVLPSAWSPRRGIVIDEKRGVALEKVDRHGRAIFIFPVCADVVEAPVHEICRMLSVLSDQPRTVVDLAAACDIGVMEVYRLIRLSRRELEVELECDKVAVYSVQDWGYLDDEAVRWKYLPGSDSPP